MKPIGEHLGHIDLYLWNGKTQTRGHYIVSPKKLLKELARLERKYAIQ